ncbi:hypothetical protein GDO86_003287 [Hymenochirus boettgeri]|uniref:Sushi domain-containing protein n=1 Tax=Hymenochirus boettgeri TaxID=247094 RepID=A0A8T2K098_9PIPI|nr:hypothetical protein GDO86_003287 [Hymenochirus boettgeri]
MSPHSSITRSCTFIFFCFLSSFTGIKGSCGPPPKLTFGEPKSETSNDSYPEGTVIQYSCRPGYKPVSGAATSINCKGGVWAYKDFCEVLTCGSPGEVQNGQWIEPINQTVGSTVYFKCDPGYRSTSKQNSRYCGISGTWSDVYPNCEAQTCAPPDPFSDGTFQPAKEEYNYQDSVSYKCSKGLALIGETSIFCTAEGKWSSNVPICRDVECENPVVENGEKTSGFRGPYRLNFAVSFNCKDGYKLVGSDHVTCTVNNTWAPLLPVCQKITDKENGDNQGKPGNGAAVIVGNLRQMLVMFSTVLAMNTFF